MFQYLIPYITFKCTGLKDSICFSYYKDHTHLISEFIGVYFKGSCYLHEVVCEIQQFMILV